MKRQPFPKESVTTPKRLPHLAHFSAEQPPNATPYLPWVKGMGFSRSSAMNWAKKGLVTTFKFPDELRGMLWIQFSEVERFGAVLKGEQPPNLPPPSTPAPTTPAALEWVGNASTILSSPMLSGITASASFNPPSPSQPADWEKEWANLWGIFRREFHPELYPPHPSQPSNEKAKPTTPTTT